MAADYTLQLRSHSLDVDGSCPPERSAHNTVLGPDNALYVTAGDSGNAGQRFNDIWRLFNSSRRTGSSGLAWQQLLQQQPSDEDKQQTGYCTARSNAAGAATADWLFLFGGWDCTGLQPLSHLEAFSFRSQTWHTPAPSGSSPSPRGQPAAAANTAGTAVYFFGGWDGKQRFNDLHKLCLTAEANMAAGTTAAAAAAAAGAAVSQGEEWVWQKVTPQPAPPKGARAGITFEQQQALLKQQQGAQPHSPQQQEQQAQALQLPCERADHVMVCWHYCDDGVWKDLLVVFGGSCSDGLLNDTWLFDINTSSWTKAYYGGAAPCARSSCAAAITGDVMLLHGGQTPAGVLHDMHLLNLSTLTWIQVDLGPVLRPLCRHSMVVSDSNCFVFGGFDGTAATNQLLQIDLQPVQQLQRSSLQDLINSMACCGSTSVSTYIGHTSKGAAADKAAVLSASEAVQAAVGGSIDAGCTGSADERLSAVGVVLPNTAVPSVPPGVKALSKKATPPPLKLIDLPNAEEVAGMPQWKQVRQLHQAALAAGCDQYIDPKTGYTVFTAKYLQQRQCCGNKCRHCPHGWVNVAKHRLQPAAAAATAATAASLDWY